MATEYSKDGNGKLNVCESQVVEIAYSRDDIQRRIDFIQSSLDSLNEDLTKWQELLAQSESLGCS